MRFFYSGVIFRFYGRPGPEYTKSDHLYCGIHRLPIFQLHPLVQYQFAKQNFYFYYRLPKSEFIKSYFSDYLESQIFTDKEYLYLKLVVRFLRHKVLLINYLPLQLFYLHPVQLFFRLIIWLVPFLPFLQRHPQFFLGQQ